MTLSALVASVLSKHPDCYRTTQQMILARGYPAENHTIVTEDGYLLVTFRIPARKGRSYSGGSPVLLAHGVLGSSDNSVDNGDLAAPYLLADEGFDVWMMNNRGNRYSRGHVTLSPDDDNKYWDFSLHEMGVYDIKANIEYIRNVTGQEKVSFVGYSQSGGSILAAMSENMTYYKQHLRSVVMWAPAVNMEHSNNLLKLVYSTYLLYAIDFFGMREFFPYDPNLCSFTSVLCKLNPAICSLALAFVSDMKPYYDNQERWEVLMAHYPVGTSVRSLLHLIDLKIYAGFVKHRKTFLHSVELYNLSNIDSTVPMAIMVGKEDQLVSVKDGQWLAGLLTAQGALKSYHEYAGMGHITFVIPSPKVDQFIGDTVSFIKSH